MRVSNVDKKSTDGDRPVELCNYTDVYRNERITPDLRFMAATATVEQVATFGLRAGDVLLTKDSETADDIGVSAVVSADIPNLVCGYHLAVIRAKPTRAYGPYLRWVIASDRVRQAMSSAATGVTRFGLRSEAIADLAIPVRPIAEQRAIADYLDRGTARIDALIAAKRGLADLTLERMKTVVERLIWSDAPERPIPLRRLARRIDVGIAEAATHAYADDGVPLLRSMNIRENRLDAGDLLFIEPWFADRNRSKYVRSGDILTVRTGNVGVSAVVPDNLDLSQCFTQLITTVREPHDPQFVCFALNSRRTREYFELVGWGSAQANISVPLLAAAPLPDRPPEAQRKLGLAIEIEAQRANRLIGLIEAQVEPLREWRQALITAVVTGQLAVPALA